MTERNVKKRQKKQESKDPDPQQDKDKKEHWSQRVDSEKDVLLEEESPISAFSDVFSDSEEEDENEDDDDEEYV